MSEVRKRRRRKWRFLGAFVLVFVAAAFLLRDPIRAIPGNLLVADDAPEKGATYLALLLGDSTSGRAEKSVDLFEAGYAPKILIAAERQSEFVRLGIIKGDAARHQDFLLAQGVPEDAIEILSECATTSTYEEALCFRNRLAGERAARLVVVTSWYHTSRARWLFQRVFADTEITPEIVPAPLWDHGPTSWWKHEDSFLAVFNEYLKWAYWRVRL